LRNEPMSYTVNIPLVDNRASLYVLTTGLIFNIKITLYFS
jgi:hypothetical protein